MIIPSCTTVQTPVSPVTPAAETPLAVGEFSSNPAMINPGGTSTLSWNMTGSDSVSIDQGIGKVTASGSMQVSPSESTFYTMSATNSTGTVTRSAMTTVNSVPPTTASMPFAVTNVAGNTEPSSFSGACPKLFTFYATITANGPGTVTYIWESAGAEFNEYSEIQSITFDAAGTKTTTLKWELAGSAFGLHRVHVLTPNDIASTPVLYELSCAGDKVSKGIIVGITPDESGSLIKSGMDYTKSSSVSVGDTNGNLASRAFLSFDISSIPGNAVIDEVALNLEGYTTTGNPTYADPINGPKYGNFGALEIYRYQYGTYADLDTFAYNKPGEMIASGTINSYPIAPRNLALDIKDPACGEISVQCLVKNGKPNFQLKAQFFTSTNWDGIADMILLDQAMLIVKYHLP